MCSRYGAVSLTRVTLIAQSMEDGGDCCSVVLELTCTCVKLDQERECVFYIDDVKSSGFDDSLLQAKGSWVVFLTVVGLDTHWNA